MTEVQADHTGSQTNKVRAIVMVEKILNRAYRPNQKESLDPPYEVIWANGDEGKAKDFVAEWCKKNPGKKAWIMVATSTSPVMAEMTLKWSNNV